MEGSFRRGFGAFKLVCQVCSKIAHLPVYCKTWASKGSSPKLVLFWGKWYFRRWHIAKDLECKECKELNPQIINTCEEAPDEDSK